MGRLLLAILVGVIVNGALVFGVRGLLGSDGDAMTGMLLVLLAYAIGAFGGGFVATKLAPNRGLMPALVIGQISLVFIIINLLQLPHPIWLLVASLLVPLPSAWFGGKVAHARGGLK